MSDTNMCVLAFIKDVTETCSTPNKKQHRHSVVDNEDINVQVLGQVSVLGNTTSIRQVFQSSGVSRS